MSDLAVACAEWGPVLTALDCEVFQDWPDGRSWRRGGSYVVLEQSRDLRRDVPYDRMRAGLNHLAVRGTRAAVDAATGAGWTVRVDTGATCHLLNSDGFELELVLDE